MINLGRLKPDTLAGLQLLSHERQWPELYAWTQEETVAWLTYRLRYAEDKPEYFPHGKWATIQRLQGFVEESAEEDELTGRSVMPTLP